MRGFKVLNIWFLTGVAVILLFGAGFLFYYLLLKPQIEAVAKAHSDWSSARDAYNSVLGKYDTALDGQVKSAEIIVADNLAFHQIQDHMPMIYDMKDDKTDWKSDRDALRYWYNVMGSGKMITTLNAWAKGFHFSPAPNFTYSGTLGYETTLPNAKFVAVDFGQQKFTALGYPQLLQEINTQTGHDYFPLLIDLGASPSIDVDPTNKKHRSKTPALTLNYSATGYFFTRGWDLPGAGRHG